MTPKWLSCVVLSVMLIQVIFLMACSPIPGTTPTQTNQQPVEVISVSGPLEPVNPGGPIVEITLKNVASEPVVSLNATLEKVGIRAYSFTFNVSSSNPLL